MTAPAPMTASAGKVRSPLRGREFGLVWLSGLISDTGDWLLMIALPLYVFAITGSAIGTSTVFLAELVPVLVLGPLLGVFVDRFDHRRTMIVVNVAQGIALLPLLFVTPDRIWIVYVIAAVQAALAAGFNPARYSLLPRLVPTAQLGSANSLIAVSDNLSRLVGAPIGGLVFVTSGLVGVVMLDAASYLLSAILVWLSRSSRPVPAADAVSTAAGDAVPAHSVGFVRELLGGFATIRRNRPLSALLAIEAVASVAQGIFLVLFVVYVVRILDASEAEVGLLRGVQAIGGVLGGLIVGVLARRLSSRVLIGWGFILFGVLALATWNFSPVSTGIAFYVAFFIAMGIPAVAVGAGMMTMLQTVTPQLAMGRVVATVGTSAQAAQGVGLLLGGLVADRLGVVVVLDGQAALYLICGVLALVSLRLRPL
jgi:predicted MFS family arabinose efflux permease